MEIETLSLRQGFLAKPKGAGNFPAVLVLHEWWGLNEHIKEVTGRFAKEGWVAFAPDLYGRRVTQDPGEASAWMTKLRTDQGMELIKQAFEYLKAQPFVTKGKIGITGFCMGGSYALLAACRLKGLSASAPFYGNFPDKIDEMEKIKCPVLFFAGGKDGWITQEVVGKIEAAFKKYKIRGTVQRYEQADHAFFNDTRPEAYDRAAALDAWKRVLQFFRENG